MPWSIHTVAQNCRQLQQTAPPHLARVWVHDATSCSSPCIKLVREGQLLVEERLDPFDNATGRFVDANASLLRSDSGSSGSETVDRLRNHERSVLRLSVELRWLRMEELLLSKEIRRMALRPCLTASGIRPKVRRRRTASNDPSSNVSALPPRWPDRCSSRRLCARATWRGSRRWRRRTPRRSRRRRSSCASWWRSTPMRAATRGGRASRRACPAATRKSRGAAGSACATRTGSRRPSEAAGSGQSGNNTHAGQSEKVLQERKNGKGPG